MREFLASIASILAIIVVIVMLSDFVNSASFRIRYGSQKAESIEATSVVP